MVWTKGIWYCKFNSIFSWTIWNDTGWIFSPIDRSRTCRSVKSTSLFFYSNITCLYRILDDKTRGIRYSSKRTIFQGTSWRILLLTSQTGFAVSLDYSSFIFQLNVKTRLWIIFRSENTRYYLLLSGLLVYAQAVVCNIKYLFEFCAILKSILFSVLGYHGFACSIAVSAWIWKYVFKHSLCSNRPWHWDTCFNRSLVYCARNKVRISGLIHIIRAIK